MFAACGGGGDDDDDGAATDRTGSAADEELADALLLVAADLPGEFEEQAADDPGDDEDDPFDRCLGEDAGKLDETTAEADSPDFETDESLASSSAAVFASDADAREALDVLRSDDLTECFQDAITEGIRGEASADGDELPDLAVALSDLDFADVGDELVSFRAAISFAVQGQEIEFPFDLIFVRVGRGIGLYAFAGFGAPFPADDAEAAVEAAVGRAA